MTGGLFNPEAFEQMPGQMSMGREAEPFKRYDAIVFTYFDVERSGEFWASEPTCGATVVGWADGRDYLVAHDAVRHETDQERSEREKYGRYVEDGPR